MQANTLGKDFFFFYLFMRLIDNIYFFRIIEQHRVNALFTVPTVFRVLRRADPETVLGRNYSLKS